VHKSDLTGIEILSRITEQVMKRQIPVMEECRAVELLLDESGKAVTGALLLDMRTSQFIVVEAKATLVATGGGPTQYRFHALVRRSQWMVWACSCGRCFAQGHGDAPVPPRDSSSQVAWLLDAPEEGLRGAGPTSTTVTASASCSATPGLNERATRDVVSRSSYMEMMAPGLPEGGVYIDASTWAPIRAQDLSRHG